LNFELLDFWVLGRKASKPVQIPEISELAPEKAARPTSKRKASE
jgi:hypothetical protein